MRVGIWMVVVSCLLGFFVDSMWTDSTDLAHHYSLVARLSEYWSMPPGSDRTLGEMNYYPRGAHALAALISVLVHSDLLGMQLLVLASVIAIWTCVVLLVLNLPGITRWWSAGVLGFLLLINHKWPFLEMHGGELVISYFFSQIVAQVGALVMLVVTLYGERSGRPAWQRNLLLVAACWVIEQAHLLPVMELLGFYAVLLLFDALKQRSRAGWVQAVLWLLFGLAVVVKHPTFRAMKEISRNDGTVNFVLFSHMPVILLYCLLVVLVSSLMLWRWYRLPADKQPLWLVWKMVGAYGLAVAGFCLLQALAFYFGQGSMYAVKKHLFAVNTVVMLEAALWAGWYCTRFSRVQWVALPHAGAALMLAFVVVAVLPKNKLQDVSDLVSMEREMLTLRTMINTQPGKYTHVLQMANQPPFINYMYSIGIFKVPRFRTGFELFVDQPFAKSSMLGAIITTANSKLDRYPACRKLLTIHGLVWVDYACFKREADLVDTYYSLSDDPQDIPCTFDGFSPVEQLGRWTSRRVAGISCTPPKSKGKPFTHLVLDTEGFLARPLQRLQVVQNGVVTNEFRYDLQHPHQMLNIELKPDADGDIDLELRLPDARSPRDLHLSDDRRELGISIESLEFTMK